MKKMSERTESIKKTLQTPPGMTKGLDKLGSMHGDYKSKKTKKPTK